MTMRDAAKKSLKALYNTMPILLAVVLLIGLLTTVIPAARYTSLFSRSSLLDALIGSSLGSILTGNPITSYVLGGELLGEGVGLVAVTAFLLAWVTVGLVQMPAEAMLLGKKFALLRNFCSFLFSIVIAVFVVSALRILGW